MKKLKKIMAGIMAVAMIGSVGALNASAVTYISGGVSPELSNIISSTYGEDTIVFSSNYNNIINGESSTTSYSAGVITADGICHWLQESYRGATINTKDRELPLDEINERLPEGIPDITLRYDGAYTLSNKYFVENIDEYDEACEIIGEYYEVESITENSNLGIWKNEGIKCVWVHTASFETELTPEEFEEKYSDFYSEFYMKHSSGEEWSYNEETGKYRCAGVPWMVSGEEKDYLVCMLYPEVVKSFYNYVERFIEDGVDVYANIGPAGEIGADEYIEFSNDLYTSPEDGDLTGDYEINLYDVVEISKYIMGMNSLTEKQLKLGDVNKDDVCNLYDAVEIAKGLM